MKTTNAYKPWVIVLLLLAILYAPVFMHLDYMPIRMWDESFLGVHTFEMLQDGDYIVTHNNGQPEMVNCKPPLAIWAMALCSKVLGFSELSMRLPSALAALILCLALFYLLRRYTNSTAFAFFAVVILITSRGYVRNHVIRTAEYDSILVLFSSLAALQLFFATEAEEKSKQGKHLLYFFIAVTLAVLDKGVAIMMMAPGLFLYVLLRGKLVPFLKNKYTYIGIAVFLLFGVGYYFLRESMNPGYLQAVWDNELGGRYTQDIATGAGEGWIFYLREIWQWQFVPYFGFLPVGIAIGLWYSPANVRRLTLFSLVIAISFLVIISSSATKLPHYNAPAFPFLAILTAPFFYLLYISVRNYGSKNNEYKKPVLAFVLVLLLFAKPYLEICQTFYFPKGDYWEEEFSITCSYFRDSVHKRIPQPYKLTSIHSDKLAAGQVLRCYSYMLQTNKLAEGIVPPEKLSVGDTAILFDWNTSENLKSRFELKLIESIDKYHAQIVVLAPK